MFVIPSSCVAFGKCIPPVGTRVAYTVIVDTKTGRPRAEDVAPEESAQAAMQQVQSLEAGVGGGGGGGPGPQAALAGTIIKATGQFGFIQQDSGGENMFVIPSSCPSFGNQVPPIGTRVTYGIITDNRTGRPRADWVEPEGGGSAGSGTWGAVGQGAPSHPHASAPY